MSIITYLNTTDVFNLCKTHVHCVATWQVWVSSLEDFPSHSSITFLATEFLSFNIEDESINN